MFTSESARSFEEMKEELLRTFPGQYALVCGRRLMGVFAQVDEAMAAASRLFDGNEVPAGMPMLISEISPRSGVRVMAAPYRRGGGTVTSAGAGAGASAALPGASAALP